MTQITFSDYTARLREFIRRSSPGAPATDALSAAEKEQGFGELARALFELQFASNAPYRRFCGASPGDISDWAQIPAIPASAFKHLELTSLAPAERTAVFHSSGTTAQMPSVHYHNKDSLEIYEASLLPWFRAHLLADLEPPGSLANSIVYPAMRMVFLTPPPELAPRSSLVHMFEAVRRHFGSPDSLFTGDLEANGGWSLRLEHTRRELARAAADHRTVMLLGTAFGFVHLLEDLGEANARFQLPAGSRVLETGGYKGRSRVLAKSELHSLITEYLGITPDHIVSEYGMSELSSQAYDWGVERPKAKVQSPKSRGQASKWKVQGPTSKIQSPNSKVQGQARLFRFPPWVRVRLISPETGREAAEGEMGLIRVFDLANLRSVMAIQTEDLGISRGTGFELIGRARLAEPRGCSLMAVQDGT